MPARPLLIALTVFGLSACEKAGEAWRADLENEDAFVRLMAVIALEDATGTDLEPALVALVLRLEDADPRVRARAVGTAAVLARRFLEEHVFAPDAANAPDLVARVQRLGPALLPVLGELVFDEDPARRRGALAALSHFAVQSPQQLPTVLERLTSAAVDRRREIADPARRALEELCHRPTAAAALTLVLPRVVGEERRLVIATLATSLARGLRASVAEVRREARVQIVKLGADAVPPLLADLETTPARRSAALEALAVLPPKVLRKGIGAQGLARLRVLGKEGAPSDQTRARGLLQTLTP